MQNFEFRRNEPNIERKRNADQSYRRGRGATATNFWHSNLDVFQPYYESFAPRSCRLTNEKMQTKNSTAAISGAAILTSEDRGSRLGRFSRLLATRQSFRISGLRRNPRSFREPQRFPNDHYSS